jgi:isoleucyl-tRNA synthetase
VLKDRLYTTPRTSHARRSAQSALALIRDALLKAMAPILCFTAEEAWRIVHHGDPSIFVHVFAGSLPEVAGADALGAKWQRILAVRSAVLKELESLRADGKIGSSLQAEVTVAAPDEDYEALASLGDDLRFVFITSAANVERSDALAVAVNPSPSPKCERCWHWRADVGDDPKHPLLCGRCVSNLFGSGEPRAFA